MTAIRKSISQTARFQRITALTTDRCSSNDRFGFIVFYSYRLSDIYCEIKKHAKDIFFHKRKEWEHEQEFRIVQRCPSSTRCEYLELGKSLKYIILGPKSHNIDEIQHFKKIKKLEMIAQNIPILIYGNGLMNYSLITLNGNNEIWNSVAGYDILIPEENCKLNL